MSADSHWLEPDGFVDRMPEKFRDRAPRGRWGEDGYHFEADGRSLDNPALPSMLIEGVEGMWDVPSRMRDLDAEGVEKGMVFGQKAFGVIRSEDMEYVQSVFDAYNELLAEFCAKAPGRLYGVGMLNYWDPARTKDELQKLKALDYRGAVMPSLPPRVYYNSRAMEPMWDAIEEAGLPVSFHVGETFDARGLGGLATTIVVAFQPFRRLWSLLTFSGILERHPGLRVVFTEGGIAWVPSALYDADRVYASFESQMNPKLANPPSFYWHQNCLATFMEDPYGLQQIDLIGAENAMWSSDYGHPESTIGYTRKSIEDIYTQVGEEAAGKIVGGNALRVWDLS